MKNVLLVVITIWLISSDANCQWLKEKYGVKHIDQLTTQQLDEALGDSEHKLLIAGVAAGIGGSIYLISKYTEPSLDEDASLFEQIIGAKGKQALGIIGGLGMFTGCSIACIVYLIRIERIKTTINNKYPYEGALKFSPAIIVNSSSGLCYPGITLTYNF